MPAFNGQAIDLQGNAVTAFQVEVRDESSGLLAPIYSDKTLSTPLGNPFTPNPLDNGYFRFYVAAGNYRIKATDTSGSLSDWRDVPIGDDAVALSAFFLDESQNLSDVDTPATAFDNIKQPASTSATGVVEKATSAEVQAATADKFIAADNISGASAAVALTDAATIALDWNTFINGTVTLTANRTLGNPTNGQAGTWRTVLVQGDAATSPATARTLTFGNQYLGDLPTLADITDNRWYLLMIYCVSSTHFVVSAKRAHGPSSGT